MSTNRFLSTVRRWTTRGALILALFVVMSLVAPMGTPVAHAAGVVSVCDETHLKAALSGGGIVTFSCSGTITLTSPINITTNTTLDGAGQTVTISGGNTVRVFAVTATATFTLQNLTVANGFAVDGGGIYISAWSPSVFLTNTVFSGNSALIRGGGIYNYGGV